MSDARDLPPLNALRAFEAVARLGSVTRAAQALHVTHGAISRQLRLLEDDLGCALFQRSGRQLVLTDAGRQLGEVASATFEQLREVSARLRQHPAADTLVLGCPGSVLARWMIPRMERLGRDLPGLQLHLSARENIELAPWPAGIDAVLMIGQAPVDTDLATHSLAPERIGPVLSPQHPQAEHLRHAPPSALCDAPLLHTASRPQAWPTWAAAQQLPPDSLQPKRGFDHLYYLLEAAVAGLGVAIAPQPLVADDLAAGRLIAPWGFVETEAAWLLCAADQRHQHQLAPLAAWLRAQLDA
ncbi:LysR family transcriptional regulator [Oleiagrimonas sp. C23AA]|uniref:LysR family transcriptional regulator n=1 Tax=Oleiagrimonas sp. C23AA TaxID=2719047 RepID=UPI001421DA66|nr:LysR family transcriptional regulator [Oleiagrimonas sp. C23AA]NII10178.1 LysR family transcriptional regulator [Oleiagrimonas sp. C23AA]